MLKLNKKAAMFGLDARIALAIFGALSVISGAALYSAIQESKATAMLTELTEMGKAWESYYLDTGELLPQNLTNPATDSFYILKVEDLVNNNGVAGWAGPYMPLTVNNTYLLNHPQYATMAILYLTESAAWGDTASWHATGKCLSGTKCYIWIYLSGIDNMAAVKAIDRKIDQSDGATAGAFKWWTDSDATNKTRILLRYAPVKNPND